MSDREAPPNDKNVIYALRREKSCKLSNVTRGFSRTRKLIQSIQLLCRDAFQTYPESHLLPEPLAFTALAALGSSRSPNAAQSRSFGHGARKGRPIVIEIRTNRRPVRRPISNCGCLNLNTERTRHRFSSSNSHQHKMNHLPQAWGRVSTPQTAGRKGYRY